jgi:hypothetical protein
MQPIAKTILIAGNQGGGQFKSTTLASLADALQTIGYSTKTISIDCPSSPSTLQRLCPDTVSIPANNGGAAAAMEAAYDSPEDFVIIDSPTRYTENLANQLLSLLTKGGTRIVVGVIINPRSENSFELGMQFAQAFAPYTPEYIVLAVSDGLKKSTNFLVETKQGQLLTQLARGRVIEFPAYCQLMRSDQNARPAVPSVHISNAENVFTAEPWRVYHNEVTQSVSQHAEWLVGKTHHLLNHPTSQKPHIEEENQENG